MGKVIRALCYGTAYCFTRYMYFAIPAVWYWLPIMTLGYYLSDKEAT